MNVKKQILNAIMCATVGTFGLGLASCDKNGRELPVDPSEKTYEVTTEAFFLEEDGTLVPFSANDLRATESEKGTITGAGQYFHNEQATIKATPKGTYKLYSLYEKSGYNGLTEATGKPASGEKSKTISVPVIQDLHFIAVFMGQEGNERGYKDLKIAGTNGDYRFSTIGAKATTPITATTIGTEVSPVKTYDGTIQEWEASNESYKNWDIQGSIPAWFTATVVNGVLTITPTQHIGKSPARTATFKVGKNGTVQGAPSVWRTITVTQNSYYEADGVGDSINDIKITDGNGTVVGVPATLATTYLPTGGSKDLKTLHNSLSTPLFAQVPVYVNGQKTTDTVKKPITLTWSAPSDAWLTKGSGSTYSAGINNGKVTRSATVKVEFKVGSTLLKTTTITATQAPRKYNVGGEVK